MKVALICEHADPRRGGAERSTLEMADALSRTGLRVAVVSARFVTPPPGDVEAIEFRPKGGTRLSRTRYFARHVANECRSRGFDVVHSVMPCDGVDVYQPRSGTYLETITRTLARTPPAWRWMKAIGRRWNFRQRMLRRVEESLLCREEPPFVAAGSEYVRRQVLALRPDFPAHRLRVVFNGVRISGVPPGELAAAGARLRGELRAGEVGEGRAGIRILLFAAFNFRLKGLPELLRALRFAILHEDGATSWRLVVAGRPPSRADYARVARFGLKNSVRFLGPVANILEWLAAADVLVHPTWYDPCSRVVLEALATGVPVVTTTWNGASEAVRHPWQGAVIEDPSQPADLAAAIVAALAQRRPTAAELEAVRWHLSMDRHARELAELYEAVRTPGAVAGPPLKQTARLLG